MTFNVFPLTISAAPRTEPAAVTDESVVVRSFVVGLSTAKISTSAVAANACPTVPAVATEQAGERPGLGDLGTDRECGQGEAQDD